MFAACCGESSVLLFRITCHQHGTGISSQGLLDKYIGLTMCTITNPAFPTPTILAARPTSLWIPLSLHSFTPSLLLFTYKHINAYRARWACRYVKELSLKLVDVDSTSESAANAQELEGLIKDVVSVLSSSCVGTSYACRKLCPIGLWRQPGVAFGAREMRATVA